MPLLPNAAGTKSPRRTAAWVRRFACAATPMLLAGCDVLKLGVVNHAGPVAESQWHLYLIVGAVLVFVAGPVLLLTPLMAWHYRLSQQEQCLQARMDLFLADRGADLASADRHRHRPWFRAVELHARARPVSTDRIGAAAVRNPGGGARLEMAVYLPGRTHRAVNELDIPVGRPVHITLTSGTVMQSLMVPQLAGQIYAMAGMKTQLNFAASRTGVYPRREHAVQRHRLSRTRSSTSWREPPPTIGDGWLVCAHGRPLDAAGYARCSPRRCRAAGLLFRCPPDLFPHPARGPRVETETMTNGIWPAVLGRFAWDALPFVRAWENPTSTRSSARAPRRSC